MAAPDLVLDFSLCSNNSCADIRVQDTSIDWASSSIPIGDPNAYVIIAITDSAGNSEIYDVSAVFAAASIQSELVYDSEDYNGGPFTDGKYTISYSIYIDSTATTPTYTKEISIFITCTLACCIEKKALSLKNYMDCNNCGEEYIMYYYKMEAMYEALRYAVAFNDFTTATELLSTLNDLCDITNCNCN